MAWSKTKWGTKQNSSTAYISFYKYKQRSSTVDISLIFHNKYLKFILSHNTLHFISHRYQFWNNSSDRFLVNSLTTVISKWSKIKIKLMFLTYHFSNHESELKRSMQRSYNQWCLFIDSSNLCFIAWFDTLLE